MVNDVFVSVHTSWPNTHARPHFELFSVTFIYSAAGVIGKSCPPEGMKKIKLLPEGRSGAQRSVGPRAAILGSNFIFCSEAENGKNGKISSKLEITVNLEPRFGFCRKFAIYLYNIYAYI